MNVNSHAPGHDTPKRSVDCLELQMSTSPRDSGTSLHMTVARLSNTGVEPKCFTRAVPKSPLIIIVNVGLHHTPARVLINDLEGQAVWHREGACRIFKDLTTTVYTLGSRADILEFRLSTSSGEPFSHPFDIHSTVGGCLGAATYDPVIHHLSTAIMPALSAGCITSQSFADCYILSFLNRIMDDHDTIAREDTSSYAGGLSPANKRNIESILREPKGLQSSLGCLAKACKLSPGHFSRAFRLSFGTSVHQFLLRSRIRHAQELLQSSSFLLTEIARHSGFADQATFTECFSRILGTSPGRYRRCFLAQRGHPEASSEA